MKLAAITSALLLSLAVTTPVAAAEPPAKDRAHESHKQATGAPDFAALDKNKDGSLSKEEMAKHPMAAHFGMMDADKDGKLSKSEYKSM